MNGTVVVTSDGTTYEVRGERGDARGPPLDVTTQTSSEIAGPFAIDVESLTSPASPGSTAELTIRTSPGADCSIAVNYKSGPSHAAGLGPQAAGSDGTATWRWNVGSRTTPERGGSW